MMRTNDVALSVRMLETCFRMGCNAVLVEGFPPLLRMHEGLRKTLAPVIDRQWFDTDFRAILGPSQYMEEFPGGRSYNIQYRTVCRFRINIVGGASPTAVFVTKLPIDAPPSLAVGGESWYKYWSADGPAATWSLMLQSSLLESHSTVVLTPGCPPLAWTKYGLFPFCVPPWSATEVAAKYAEILQPPPYRDHREGYWEFDVRLGDVEVFRAAGFGGESPNLVLVMRTSTSAPS